MPKNSLTKTTIATPERMERRCTAKIGSQRCEVIAYGTNTDHINQGYIDFKICDGYLHAGMVGVVHLDNENEWITFDGGLEDFKEVEKLRNKITRWKKAYRDLVIEYGSLNYHFTHFQSFGGYLEIYTDVDSTKPSLTIHEDHLRLGTISHKLNRSLKSLVFTVRN